MDRRAVAATLVLGAAAVLLILYAVYSPSLGRFGDGFSFDPGPGTGEQPDAGAGGGQMGGDAASIPLDLARGLADRLGLQGLFPSQGLPSWDHPGFGTSGSSGGGSGDGSTDGGSGGGDGSTDGGTGGDGSGSTDGDGSGSGSTDGSGAGGSDGGSDSGGLGDGFQPRLPADWRVLAALAVVPALLALGYLARRSDLSAPTRVRSTAVPALDLADSPHVDVEFPRIDPDLPPVWGVDDPPLEVQARTDLEGEPRLLVDGEPASSVPPAEGEYLVAAEVGDHRTEELVRIVRYEKEVVRLFNELARVHGVDTDDRTPREVVRRLRAQGLDPDPLRTILRRFEACKYAGASVGRDAYVDQVRAVRRLRPASSPRGSGAPSASGRPA